MMIIEFFELIDSYPIVVSELNGNEFLLMKMTASIRGEK